MAVGILTITLRIPGVHSLKQKRSVLKSLLVRLRQKFNISIAEVNDHDKWQSAVLEIACVSSNRPLIHQSLEHVLKFIDKDANVLVIGTDVEIL